ncbi:Maf family protein [Domibacillus epiphyticus]|uniref:dTTP/UTP pyrophosphatase n=1 Tax=Domibacillus epiphyticus TaxID=1714355 RepID=A0A1V2A978_9BACI|nr:Maf family protein [Domibacillus epiphyticus]OMP67543.1 septum formation inhibitor Maf [Domibacillus epiphyticus]
MTNIILASSSPRRKELLSQVNISYTVHPADADETIPKGTAPADAVEQLALRKAEAVFALYPDAAVIGADTVVVKDGQILGKPAGKAEAAEMISSLSGTGHSVYTGVAIITRNEKVIFHEKTNVEFWELTEEEIASYIETGEPFDKAGGYGIQSAGALFVKAIRGDYFTVVGLPLSSLYRHLKHLGIITGSFSSSKNEGEWINGK